MTPFQIRFGDEDLLIDLEAFFRPLFLHLENFERRIMTDLVQLNAKVDALSAQLAAANGKTDLLIGLTTDLQALVKQFQSAVPITDADVQAVIDKIDAISASVTTETAKEDSALTPSDPPAAAPVAPDPGATASST